MKPCLPAAALSLACLLASAAFASGDPVRYEFFGNISGLYSGDLEARPDVEVVFPLGSPISFTLCWEPETLSSFPGEYLGAILDLRISHANYTTPLTLGLASAFVWPEIPTFSGYGDAAGPPPALLPTIRPAFVEFLLEIGGPMLADGPPLFIPEGPLAGGFTLAFRDVSSSDRFVFVDSAINSVRAVPMPGTLPLFGLGAVVWALRSFYLSRDKAGTASSGSRRDLLQDPDIRRRPGR